MPIKLFGNKSAKAALNEYNDTPRVVPELPYSVTQDDPLEILWGTLDSNLSAAVTPDAPTTATFSVYNPVTWTDTGRDITVTNRSGSAFTASQYLAVYRVYDLNTFYPFASGGGGTSGVTFNEAWKFSVLGFPLGGSFDMTTKVNNVNDTQTINLTPTATAATIQTALEAHPQISSGDVSVSGGSVPFADICIDFTGNLAGDTIAQDAEFMKFDWTNLTGGTAVGIIASVVRTGGTF